MRDQFVSVIAELHGKESTDASKHSTANDSSIKSASTPTDVMDEEITLITTTTCPNCSLAKRFLDEAGVRYNVEVADDEKTANLAKKLNITSAPTLVVKDGDKVKLYENVSNIRDFIDNNK